MNIIYTLILSLLLGSFIGIERQLHITKERQETNSSFLGLRTFALITSLGTISGFLEIHIPSLFIIISIAIVVIIVGYYVFDCLTTKDFGITTEVTLIFSYVIGILLATDVLSVQLIIGITVILVFILSQKERLNTYVNSIKNEEMQSFIRYAIIALVILPLLPDIAVRIASIPYASSFFQSLNLPYSKLENIEIVNPFQLWLFVALVTGIDVLGYLAGRLLGKKKGWLLTSFAGGFISSTATTTSLAQKSKKAKAMNLLVIAVLIANIASFLQHALLLFPINVELFFRAIPIILLMIFTGSVIIFFLSRNKEDKTTEIPSPTYVDREIFHLYPAIKFALLFVLIKIISSIALALFGTNGFLLAVVLGALPGLDASLITIAQAAGHSISFQYALIAFLSANIANFAVKCGFAFAEGSKQFAIKFLISVVIIIATGFLGLLIRL